MAAGKCHVVSKREDRGYHYYSKYETNHGKSGYSELELYHTHSIANQTRTKLDGRTEDRSRFVVKTSSNKPHYGCGRSSSGRSNHVSEAMEFGKLEGKAEMMPPPQKKRKFSPVVWDRDDKGLRIASKNRIVPKSIPLASGIDVLLDGHDEADIFSVGEILPSEGCRVNGQEGERLVEGQEEEVEEEYIGVLSVSTSRWANEESTIDDEDEVVTREEVAHIGSSKTKSSESSLSVESGEFKRESSEESGKRSFGSGQRVRSPSPYGSGSGSGSDNDNDSDSMEIDSKYDQVDGICEVDSEFEDDDKSCIDQLPAVSECSSFNVLQGCRSAYEYEKLNKINEGTYGIVYRAKDKKTGGIVALKKVKMGRQIDGFPVSSLREINILVSLHHPQIVNVKEVVVDGYDGVFVVMDYMEHDLKGLLEVMKQPFSQSEIKCLMLQLLEGLKYLHDNWVLHRDLKTSNLLLNNKGELKICDFGMSRQYASPLKPYTPLVVTLWYRAPELLLGVKAYSTAVDMWSVGCIMAELLAKKPLFDADSEVSQLRQIFRTLGMPNEKIWPGFSNLPGSKANFISQPYNLLRKKFPAAPFTGTPVITELGFDLLNRLLTYDPEKRITAEDALNHGWFREDPRPKCKELMPTFPPRHVQR